MQVQIQTFYQIFSKLVMMNFFSYTTVIARRIATRGKHGDARETRDDQSFAATIPALLAPWQSTE
jgi:hypothetical protein